MPADLRLVESINLRIEEAALTGESLPSEKRAALTIDRDAPLGDRANTAFSGTLVANGRGTGVVIATGTSTQIGLIEQMLAAVEIEDTPLQKRLDGLGRQLSIGALIVVAAVFTIGVLRGADLLEEFIIAVSLGFGMIPMVAPDFKMWIPHALHPLIDSGILLATVSAIVLNAFFNGAAGTEEDLRRAAEVADH